MSEKHAVWCWQVQSASIHHRSTRAEVRGGSSRSTCEQGTAILIAILMAAQVEMSTDAAEGQGVLLRRAPSSRTNRSRQSPQEAGCRRLPLRA